VNLMINEQEKEVDLQVLDYSNQHITDIEISLIYSKLEGICKYLEKENKQKQLIVEAQAAKIEKLKAELERKDEAISLLDAKFGDCVKNSEGNRQLINKLLNDIGHYQNDIDWYKRTYEKRSFWGVIREKLRNRSR
jgi:DNA repair exonuclease SbcCD ATPase subunit